MRNDVRGAARDPTWIAEREGSAVGLVMMRTHSRHAAEIHCLGVHPMYRGGGIGTALVAEVVRVLASEGLEYLQVKTSGPSRENAAYAGTLRFDVAIGFRALAERLTFRDRAISCLPMIKRP